MTKKRKALSFIIAALLLFPFIKLAETYMEYKEEQVDFEILAEYDNEEDEIRVVSNDIQDDEESEKQDFENEERFKELISLNDDFFGWLRIDGTHVDYPVMYKPDDPDYYLSKSFEKKDSVSGTPYLGKDCEPESNSIIIYGHNMRNGTMFSDLIKYQNEKFYKNHPSFNLDTVMNSAEYDIIAVFREKVHYRDEKGVFRYYSYAGELDEERFNEYLKKIKKISLYDTGISAEYGDALVTLSTCSAHTENGRFVVVGVKKQI